MDEEMTTSTSEEMSRFYRTLAMTHSNALFYVLRAADAEEMKTRASEITEQLRKIVPGEPTKCPAGTIWNPATQTCEPILPSPD